MTDANQLLRDYAKSGSESSFRELVARYLDLVYSVALRRAGGDTHSAQDIAQTVFTDLARKARSIPADVSLGGWLHRHTCFVASNVVRAERRRRERERQAVEMNSLQMSSDRVWEELGPALDEAIDQLGAADREAIVLRFFERRDLREVGVALGISEDAAQKRVSRAVDRLRERLNASGVAVTFTALGAVLVTSTVIAAPAGLASIISTTALAAAGVSTGITAGLLKVLISAKGQAGMAAVLVIAGILALVVLSKPEAGGEAKEVTAPSGLQSGSMSVSNRSATGSQRGELQPTFTPPSSEGNSVLRLEIVAADNGGPVPFAHVQVSDSKSAWGENGLLSDRYGLCDVPYQGDAGQLVIWVHLNGFADTRLLWRPIRGEVIPTNYVLRLDRPTPIGGRVVDADGNSVADVRVEWHLEDEPGGVEKTPQSHEFPWIITTTDAQGRWRIERIAEEVFRRLEGGARHTNYLEPHHVFLSMQPHVEQELRDGTHVFKMGRAASVMGTVVDSAGVPIPGAKVLVGRVNYGDSREGSTEADGTFSIPGCEPGMQWVSAKAYGYAASTVAADVGTNEPAIRLVLKQGKSLRLRVTDRAGVPMPRATVYLQPPHDTPKQSGPALRVQTSFHSESDDEGRVVWTNAPEGELRFGFMASGYLEVQNITIPADGEEHSVALASAVIVQGKVRDQSTGELLPRFRIGLGYPTLFNGTTNAEWARFDRFWVDFTNGTYRYSCDEPLQRRLDGENPGYILKFEAAGYASHVSRTIGPDEGIVQLDVTLRPAANTSVTVVKPDGRPAALVDVGFYYPGSRLQLAFGGLSREASPGGAHAQTDKNGTFELRPDDSIDRVLVVCPDGYAEATPAVLVANPILQLQPWGRLEVTGSSNYYFEFDNGLLLPTDSRRLEDRSQTSELRRRVFSKLPPGHHKLVRSSPEKETPFEIRPGQTTVLELPASTNDATQIAPP